MNDDNTFQLLIDTFSNIPLGTIIIGIIAISTLIIEYIKVAKGTSCKWWIDKAKKAKLEGRTVKAKLEKVNGYRHKDRIGNNYYYVYTYDVDGKSRSISLGPYTEPNASKTLTLYYKNNPKYAKTYSKFTHEAIRRFWPWIIAILYCIPVIIFLKLLGIPIE